MDSVKPNPKRTGAGNHLHTENMGSYDLPADFKLPEVDMEEAAAIRPSRLTGKNVTWLVLFVSGMGVSPSPMHPGSIHTRTKMADWLSLPCLVMIKVCG